MWAYLKSLFQFVTRSRKDDRAVEDVDPELARERFEALVERAGRQARGETPPPPDQGPPDRKE